MRKMSGFENRYSAGLIYFKKLIFDRMDLYKCGEMASLV